MSIVNNGLIICYGTKTTTDCNYTFYFPVSFNKKPACVTSIASNNWFVVSTITITYVNGWSADNKYGIPSYIAFGF